MTRNSGVQLKLIAIGCALCLGMGALQPVAAGPLLLGNGNAALSGTVPLLDSNAGNLHYGDIDYAVFTAAGFAAAFPLNDTPNGGVAAGEVVYAFQLYDNGAKANGITQFSAGLADLGPPLFPAHYGDGLDDNELVNAGDEDYVAMGGQAPVFMQVSASALHAPSGSSVKFNFTGTGPRLQSEWSAVLFYTSPYGPRWDNGSTTTGAGQSRIPGPEVGVVIPEPSSLALASLAMIGLAACGRRRGGM